MAKVFQAIHDYGRFLPEAKLKAALVSLNSGFHFDVGGNLDFPHPFMEHRQGVYLMGRHICSMDRGNIPEYKIWMLEPGIEDVDWIDIDKYEDALVTYMEVLPSDGADYEQVRIAIDAKRDGYHMDMNGRVFRYSACRPSMTPSYIEYVGWRHTLYRCMTEHCPGVTREALCQALGLNVHTANFNEKIAHMLPNT
jgi:hypothetical protein